MISIQVSTFKIGEDGGDPVFESEQVANITDTTWCDKRGWVELKVQTDKGRESYIRFKVSDLIGEIIDKYSEE